MSMKNKYNVGRWWDKVRDQFKVYSNRFFGLGGETALDRFLWASAIWVMLLAIFVQLCRIEDKL